MDAPVKLAIRTDRKAGVVRAYLAMTDGSDQVEMSTFNLAMLDADKQHFEDWKAALTVIVQRMVENVAGVPVGMEERAPTDN